jgi:DNA polymerase-1
MTSSKALIDGDLILYRACHAVETRMYIAYNEEGEPVACSSRKKALDDYSDVTIKYDTMIDEDGAKDGAIIIAETIDSILRATKCDEYTVYLTGKGNYRKDIYPEYKSHRPEKPKLHKVLTDYMLSMGAVMVEGQEADDALGIAQDENSILCSYDKDLMMIPGRHYDFRKKIFKDVSEEEGLRFFYIQLLTGDRTDNIPGLKGIGPKKAEKILDECKTEKEMYSAVQDAYLEKEEGNPFDTFDMITRNARLLYIRREEDELWSPPV